MKDCRIFLHKSGILEWKISRPEKRNAINFNVIDGLGAALERAEKDPEVKVFVITGEGEHAFCSGGDLEEFHQLKTEEEAYTMLSMMGNNLYKLATLPKPTFALINGSAVGGGCELATACDFRIAKSGCKIGFIQGKLGITTGWGGASLLYEKLPVHTALKMLFEANTYFSEELLDAGFIHEVHSKINIDSAYQYLKEVLKTDVNVLMAYKHALISKWHASHLQNRIEQEIRKCAILWEKDEHHQAVDKFLTR